MLNVISPQDVMYAMSEEKSREMIALLLCDLISSHDEIIRSTATHGPNDSATLAVREASIAAARALCVTTCYLSESEN